jgi:hypothetical protein
MDRATLDDLYYQDQCERGERHYAAIKGRLDEHWSNHDLVANALSGVELDRGQARALAALLCLTNYMADKVPAVLAHAILEFAHSFDELLTDYIFENTAPEDRP